MRVAAALAVLVLLAFAPAATGRRDFADVSANWAGYVAGPLDMTAPVGFTRAEGKWKVPAVRCGVGARVSASSVWIGLGGHELDAKGLEQIGTDSDCAVDGTASYYAWYELVPRPSVTLRLTVRPGDTLAASVTLSLDGAKVRFELENETRGTRFAKAVPAAAPDVSTAEWIVEAPSLCGAFTCHPVSLARFVPVTFTHARASDTVHTGAIRDWAWSVTRTRLVPDVDGGLYLGGPHPESGMPGSSAGAAPGPLSANGRSFTIAWQSSPGV